MAKIKKINKLCVEVVTATLTSEYRIQAVHCQVWVNVPNVYQKKKKNPFKAILIQQTNKK